jgi:hypothetical protein
MTVAGLAAVPAAPLLLASVSAAQPAAVARPLAALRSDVTAAVRALLGAGRRSVVLLAGGEELLVHAAGSATLASYGRPQAATALALDRALAAAIGDRGQAPSVQEAELHGDLAVLALLVAEAVLAAGSDELAADREPASAPQAPSPPLVVPVTVPSAASRGVLDGIAAGLVSAAAAVDGKVAVLAAGDLAATLEVTSPGYLVDGAAAFDAATVAALRGGDEAALAALGPREAAHVQARGWAPLTVLLAMARLSGLGVGAVGYHAPRGVGQLVMHPSGAAA